MASLHNQKDKDWGWTKKQTGATAWMKRYQGQTKPQMRWFSRDCPKVGSQSLELHDCEVHSELDRACHPWRYILGLFAYVGLDASQLQSQILLVATSAGTAMAGDMLFSASLTHVCPGDGPWFVPSFCHDSCGLHAGHRPLLSSGGVDDDAVRALRYEQVELSPPLRQPIGGPGSTTATPGQRRPGGSDINDAWAGHEDLFGFRSRCCATNVYDPEHCYGTVQAASELPGGVSIL